MKTLLRIDGSPRKESSISRQLGNQLQEKLAKENELHIINRDVYYDPLIQLGNEDSIAAYFTPVDQQTEAQKQAVEASNILAQEFANSDIYLFTVPMYNFSVSAGLKAYIDLISRAGISFNYTENGPIGLLENKKAYVVITTGGTPLGSPVDHVSGYMTTLLNFLGITDITVIKADQMTVAPENAIAKVKEEIAALETV